MNAVKHYKGGLYQILEVAIHVDSGNTLVVYQSFQDGKIWAREYKDFFGKVDVDGKLVQRFKYLDREELDNELSSQISSKDV